MTREEERLLRDAAERGTVVDVDVSGHELACCGRPFARRGAATLRGNVQHLVWRGGRGGFLLYVRGVGTVETAHVALGEVTAVRAVR